MADQRVPLTMKRGRLYRLGITAQQRTDPNDAATLAPMDLTGYVARMQVRATSSSPEPLLDLDSSVAGSMLTIDDPAGGHITLRIPGSTTAGFGWDFGVYDLEIDNTGAGGEDERTLIFGPVEIEQEITR